MAPASAIFFLFAILSNGPISFTQIGQFRTKAECMAARSSVQNGAGKTEGIRFACISDRSLGELQGADR